MRTYGQRRSKQQERNLATEVEGRVHPASGATMFAKGDVSTDTVLFECKTTGAASYTLSLESIETVWRQAVNSGKESWVMQVAFHRPGTASRKIAILDWNEYESLRSSLCTDPR